MLVRKVLLNGDTGREMNSSVIELLKFSSDAVINHMDPLGYGEGETDPQDDYILYRTESESHVYCFIMLH